MKNAQIRDYFSRNRRASSGVYALYMSSAVDDFAKKKPNMGVSIRGVNSYERILIIGPSWLGDMVMAQALFKLLKEKNNHTEIDVLAPAWSRPILARMPEVHRAIDMPVGHGRLQFGERHRLAKLLTKNNYQQAIILPNSFKSALIPWWSKIAKRTGWRGEMRWGLLNDLRHLDKQRYPLMVQRFLALGLAKDEQLSNESHYWPSLTVDATGVEQALNKYQIIKDTKPILALCPGAEFGPSKRWPTEHFSAVVKEKIAAGWQVWMFGSEKDAPIAQQIYDSTNGQAINLCGKTSLEEVVDLFSIVDWVVSNDSGLMHIAAALNKPQVVVYGSTSPGFTPPLNQQAKIISLNLACSPCFKRECPLEHLHCLTELKPQRILDVISL